MEVRWTRWTTAFCIFALLLISLPAAFRGDGELTLITGVLFMLHVRLEAIERRSTKAAVAVLQ